MIIFTRLLEAITHGETEVLASDPLTYSLVYGGTEQSIQTAFYDIYVNRPMLVQHGSRIFRDPVFLAEIERKFSVDTIIRQCGRGDLFARAGHADKILVNGTIRPRIALNK